MFHFMPESFITKCVEFCAAQHTFHGKFYGLCHVHCHTLIIPRDDLKPHAKFFERFDCLCGICFRWIEEEQETGKGHVTLIVTRVIGLVLNSLDRDPQYTEALITPFCKAFLDLFGFIRIQWNCSLSISNRATDLQ